MESNHTLISSSKELITVSKLRPTVLVFDSGVGGISVYNEIRRLLPNIHYLYVFDNAAFPYGEKTESFIIKRVVDILEGVKKYYPLTIAVIACNTAGTISLPALRARFSFPIIGVVPAIKPASRLTRNGIIGLLATEATVRRSYTRNLVAKFASGCKTKILGSRELVELAEMKLHGYQVSLSAIRQVLQPWLRKIELPDIVVLGCTHFSLLSNELQAVLPNSIRLIDSSAAIARRTAKLLKYSETSSVSSREDHLAFCTKITPEVIQFSPILKNLGFKNLEKLEG